MEEDGVILKRDYSADVTRIKEILEQLKSTANNFNTRLEFLIRELLSGRKKKLLAAAGMVASLGLPPEEIIFFRGDGGIVRAYTVTEGYWGNY